MGDAGAIGSILEDMIDILYTMYSRGELSEDKLKFAMILFHNLCYNCNENHIDLYMNEKYIQYMEGWIPNVS
mgnify:CR=1 FL=1